MKKMSTGSVQAKGDKWYFVFYNSETKKNKWIKTELEVDRRTVTTLNKSKKTAEKALTLYLKDMEENAPSKIYSKVLFGDFVSEWLKHHEGNIKDRSLKGYKETCNKHIIPWFNERKIYLQEIRPADLQGYIDEKKKILSTTTLKKHRAYISATLKYARLLELIKFNPTEHVTLPKKRGSRFVADWYNNKEMLEAIKTAHKTDEPIYAAVYLSGMCGLRREEACAMMWKNINYESRKMKVRQTAVREQDGLQIDQTTKTDTSYREVPLSESDITVLKSIERRQKLNKKMYGNSYNYDYDGYICVWPDGKLLTLDTITRRWKIFIGNHDLKEIRFQDLRASFATNLLRDKVSPERVAKLLGHSDSSTLLKYYARFADSDLVDVVDNHATVVEELA